MTMKLTIPQGYEDQTGFHEVGPSAMDKFRAEECEKLWRERLLVVAMCALTLGGGILGYWLGRLMGR